MKNETYRILLVDDEADILEFVGYNLRSEGFSVFTASDGKEALNVAQEVKPHLVLLDVMMPVMDGMETCIELRKRHQYNIIIAFLTARGEDYSQVAGFEAGGDDYIAKPIKPKVLISKVKALLKRARYEHPTQSEPAAQPEDTPGIIIDKERYVVMKNGEELFLPRKEFQLLTLLFSRPSKVFSREEIFDSIWGDNVIVGDRTIDVHIRKLREKIGDEHIKTVKGVGYKYVD